MDFRNVQSYHMKMGHEAMEEEMLEEMNRQSKHKFQDHKKTCDRRKLRLAQEKQKKMWFMQGQV